MEARYWDGKNCRLCPKNCQITSGGVGWCKVRKNVDGKLQSLVYGKPVAISADPIEKKPLYHFLPGSSSFSIGTVGCNLGCLHCQNWDMSRKEPSQVSPHSMSPEEVVKNAIEKKCRSISYTYTEPTIFFEYAIDCAKLAKAKGLKNIIVTNGYINKEPAKEFLKYMDAANVDLKGFNDDFYKNICFGSLQPILESLKIFKDLWLEITYLIIDGKNDNMQEIESMCRWISENIGDVPLHFTRCFPMYKMLDIKDTPMETLQNAKAVADKYLHYVYIGNTGEPAETKCPKCGQVLISRKYMDIEIHMDMGRCSCGQAIPGDFKGT